jgi:hypothetical protein
MNRADLKAKCTSGNSEEVSKGCHFAAVSGFRALRIVNGLTFVQGRATRGCELAGNGELRRCNGCKYGIHSRLHGNPIGTEVRTGIDCDNDRIDQMSF